MRFLATGRTSAGTGEAAPDVRIRGKSNRKSIGHTGGRKLPAERSGAATGGAVAALFGPGERTRDSMANEGAAAERSLRAARARAAGARLARRAQLGRRRRRARARPRRARLGVGRRRGRAVQEQAAQLGGARRGRGRQLVGPRRGARVVGRGHVGRHLQARGGGRRRLVPAQRPRQRRQRRRARLRRRRPRRQRRVACTVAPQC